MAESKGNSIIGEELCNRDGKKDMVSSKQLLYSEYFNQSDTFEKAFLNMKKIPSFKDFPKSDALSKVKQFMPVMAKAQTELKFRSPEEYNIETEVAGNKPAIEIGLALFEDKAEEIDTEPNNSLDLLNSSGEHEVTEDEEYSQTTKIVDIAKNIVNGLCENGDDGENDLSNSSESDTENGSTKRSCLLLSRDEESNSSSDADGFSQPRQKRLCVEEID